MDRKDFLNTKWTSYPAVVDTPQAFVFGRIVQLSEEEAVLKNQNQTITINQSLVTSTHHHHYGHSIPWFCLALSDWVGWSEATNSLYLMSPSLVESPPVRRDPRLWSQFLDRVSLFFKNHQFESIPTPFLVASPGVDHHIDFMNVVGVKTQRQWALPTSPEIHLKKALCLGYEKIFEIKNCFRDDLPSPIHHYEFTMLEWYQAFSNLKDIANLLKALIANLAPHSRPILSMTVAEAFQRWLDFELKPTTTSLQLIELAQQLGVEVDETDDWNDLFFRIFIDHIEPHLKTDQPLLLWNFPPQQASLSKVNASGWCERFELYWQGVELANAYLEENNPSENRSRFQQEEALRKKRGIATVDQDEEFFQYLEYGMPPASGIALGLDRLYQCIENSK